MQCFASGPIENLTGKPFVVFSGFTCEPVCKVQDIYDIAKLIIERGGIVEEIHIPPQLAIERKENLINYLKLMVSVLKAQRPYQDMEKAIAELVKQVAQYTTASSNYSMFPSMPFSPVVAVDGVPFESIRTRIPITSFAM